MKLMAYFSKESTEAACDDDTSCFSWETFKLPLSVQCCFLSFLAFSPQGQVGIVLERGRSTWGKRGDREFVWGSAGS